MPKHARPRDRGRATEAWRSVVEKIDNRPHVFWEGEAMHNYMFLWLCIWEELRVLQDMKKWFLTPLSFSLSLRLPEIISADNKRHKIWVGMFVRPSEIVAAAAAKRWNIFEEGKKGL